MLRRTRDTGQMKLPTGARAIVIARGRRVGATDVEVKCARGEKPKSVGDGQRGASSTRVPDAVAKGRTGTIPVPTATGIQRQIPIRLGCGALPAVGSLRSTFPLPEVASAAVAAAEVIGSTGRGACR